mmetsp:Transcript_22620/g.37300  ORF Transcript_22620/g.37300 Transcript_22620/m.37300 type:complete len:216 (+) Transcript_22620:371-1018(+)
MNTKALKDKVKAMLSPSPYSRSARAPNGNKANGLSSLGLRVEREKDCADQSAQTSLDRSHSQERKPRLSLARSSNSQHLITAGTYRRWVMSWGTGWGWGCREMEGKGCMGIHKGWVAGLGPGTVAGKRHMHIREAAAAVRGTPKAAEVEEGFGGRGWTGRRGVGGLAWARVLRPSSPVNQSNPPFRYCAPVRSPLLSCLVAATHPGNWSRTQSPP